MLIDCGATTCVTHILEQNGQVTTHKKAGFSPLTQPLSELPILECSQQITDIFFFGTGFEEVFWARAQKRIKEIHPLANITFSNDLQAAALATIGNSKGYIHIIGTGSASAYWDGAKIERPKLNLGYIFEDYASGYDIAREIIRIWNQGEFDNSEVENLSNTIQFKDVLNEIYSSDNVKSTLSSYSTLLNCLNKKSKEKIINSRLEQFYIKNIDNLAVGFPHHFIGSMAFMMEKEIREKAFKRNIEVKNIVKDTSKGLVEYYRNKIRSTHGK